MTQGLRDPDFQHQDLLLNQKVLSFLAVQTVRARDLQGRQVGSALYISRPQGGSLSDRFEVVPRLSLRESVLASQAGFPPGCSQPMEEPQKVNAHEVFSQNQASERPTHSALLSGECAGQSDGSDDSGLLLVYEHVPWKLSQVTAES